MPRLEEDFNAQIIMKTYLLALFSATIVVSSCSKESSEDLNKKPISEGSAEAGYPLDVCVVSGKKLGSMGEPYTYEHKGTTVKFCCKHCLPKFEKEPAKYLAKLKK